eukprot:CAMPEP_0167742590 /NCGR_PEP_ID=MMETSP0110_2-20121227/1521_1 /TAXON_ID=629695 /ORGANISM="Gymnochlora sp., Strain CCMP2014" /LENGTH=429 /DNA_ID=CAMNT_0007626819 /DNA_START=109 /DNA_END=1394 /DNA_ORIENTATION=+
MPTTRASLRKRQLAATVTCSGDDNFKKPKKARAVTPLKKGKKKISESKEKKHEGTKVKPKPKKSKSVISRKTSSSSSSSTWKDRAIKCEQKYNSRTTARKSVLLLDISAEPLVRAKYLRRPSRRNRSPYVADLCLLDDEKEGREVITHVPAMDCGGKCSEGVETLLKPARNRKGELVGSDAKGKYGTPKCEFIMQLVHVNEPENRHMCDGKGVWIGAHPKLGENIAESIVKQGLLNDQLPFGPVVEYTREVKEVAGTHMRVDFLLVHANGKRSILEIKTVVDTDYDPQLTPPNRKHCVFMGKVDETGNYQRAAIFPWGRANQKGPDGEKVVSARAIRHVDELALVASGELTETEGEKLGASILFIVIREDAEFFRPNVDACSSFAKHLRAAKEKGVNVLAHRVAWGWKDGDCGKCYWDGTIPVQLPEIS